MQKLSGIPGELGNDIDYEAAAAQALEILQPARVDQPSDCLRGGRVFGERHHFARSFRGLRCDALDYLKQTRRLDRLGRIGIHARFLATPPRIGAGISRERNDRDPRSA